MGGRNTKAKLVIKRLHPKSSAGTQGTKGTKSVRAEETESLESLESPADGGRYVALFLLPSFFANAKKGRHLLQSITKKHKPKLMDFLCTL